MVFTVCKKGKGQSTRIGLVPTAVGGYKPICKIPEAGSDDHVAR